MAKVSVLYYSKTGNTKRMAEAVQKGAESVEGVEARAFSLDEVDEDWLKASDCLLLGTPIYMASVCGEVKSWLEGPAFKYGLAGKLGGAFATADYVYGGGDLGIRTVLDHMLVAGMLTYSGGAAYGKPYIHIGPVAISGHLEESVPTFEAYGQRMATMAKRLFG